MLETSRFTPEEPRKPKNKKPARRSVSPSSEDLGAALARAGKEIEAEKKSRALESTKRMMKRFDDNTTRAKQKAYLEKFDKRTTEILVEREKALKESGQDAYESFEIDKPSLKVRTSEEGSVAGEIDNEPEIKINTEPSGRVTNRNVIKRKPRQGSRESQEALDMVRGMTGELDVKDEDMVGLDRILEAYEEAETADKFMDYMLETSDTVLTKEKVENDPAIRKYFQSNFKEKELGVRYEDFVLALPSEEDYVAKAFGRKVEEAEKPNKTKKIREFSEETKEALDYIKHMKDLDDGELPEKEIKEIEPVIPKKNKKDALVEAARESAAKEIPFLKPETREALKLAAQEEEDEFIRKNQKFAPKREEESAVTEVKNSTPEKIKGPAAPQAKEIKTVQERISGTRDTMREAMAMVKERAAPLQTEIDEIVQFFLQKNKDLKDQASTHQFLMGAEIKGWFKGKQRDLQAKYKEIFNRPVYKEWLKVKGKK